MAFHKGFPLANKRQSPQELLEGFAAQFPTDLSQELSETAVEVDVELRDLLVNRTNWPKMCYIQRPFQGWHIGVASLLERMAETEIEDLLVVKELAALVLNLSFSTALQANEQMARVGKNDLP